MRHDKRPAPSPDLHRAGYIDTWRCLAVTLVIVGHLFYVRGSPSPTNSHLGVLIFFFISGFVVSKTSLKELQTTGAFSIAGFYIRRVSRIVPPLMIYLAACCVLALLGAIQFDATQALRAASYLCNLNVMDCGWYAGHTWSLAFEEQFYLLFPILLVWSNTSRPRNLWLLPVFVALALLPLWFPHGWIGRTGFVVIYGLFGAGYLFAKNERLWLKLPHPGLLFALGATITFLPIESVGNFTVIKYYKFAYLFSIPLMLIASGSAEFLLRRAFQTRPMRYVGRISYSVYLWQELVIGYFAGSSIGLSLVIVAAMVLACAFLFEYVESPLIQLGRTLSKRSPAVRRMDEGAKLEPATDR
jgi:peptidoglycan/LPS O-acetylase OafA/YrhL